MKIISVITARGGSKGVHRKNITDVNGNPLIWYSIKASLESNVDETWVSTEDSEIKDISIKCGAKVIDRPSELADDIIMPDASLIHAAESIDFDVMVFIQPCAALIKPKYKKPIYCQVDLDIVVELALLKSHYKIVFK